MATWFGVANVLHHRRLQPDDRRLARRRSHAHRDGARCLGDGAVGPGHRLEGLVAHSDAGCQFTSVRYGNASPSSAPCDQAAALRLPEERGVEVAGVIEPRAAQALRAASIRGSCRSRPRPRRRLVGGRSLQRTTSGADPDSPPPCVARGPSRAAGVLSDGPSVSIRSGDHRPAVPPSSVSNHEPNSSV